MYKKYAICLAALCSLAAPLSAPGKELEPLAEPLGDLQAIFQESPHSCAALLPASDLRPRGALHALYQSEEFRLLWQQPARRTALAAQFAQLADDGLQPSHYSAQLLQPGAATAHGQTICADLRLSRDYLRALQHLAHGKVSQEQVEPFWRSPQSLNPAPRPSVLSFAVGRLDDLPGAFAAARPALAQYQALRQVYAARRRMPLPNWPTVASGRLLKPGMQDPRVPQLAARLMAQDYLPAHATSPDHRYDAALVSALQAFQRDHGLQDDGLLGNDSLSALNIRPEARLDQLRVNLERWRWLAGDFEPDILLVDIVGGLLSYYRDGQLVWQGRTQVGRPTRQTPRLKSLVNLLTLNPTWTVPPTILREDKLPAIRRDPNYLVQHQLRVLDHAGHQLDPASIDWNHPGNILLRQDAGPDNPLGQLAIRFANPFAVYLHDTPSQQLFEKSPRAFSSGCVRVQGILELLDFLLPDQCQALRTRLASGRTQQVAIMRRLPILLGYWTSEVNRDGQLVLRNDIYALDAPLLAALRRPQD